MLFRNLVFPSLLALRAHAALRSVQGSSISVFDIASTSSYNFTLNDYLSDEGVKSNLKSTEYFEMNSTTAETSTFSSCSEPSFALGTKYAQQMMCVAFIMSCSTLFIWITYKQLKQRTKRVNKEIKHRPPLHTRIHNKWYELSNFDHPGGPVALGLSEGRDATGLFESNHPFVPRKQLFRILAKYEVPSEESKTLRTLDEGDDGSSYDWEGVYNKDGFASDIRVLANDYFSSLAKERGISIAEATKATPHRWGVVFTLLGLLIASLPSFVAGRNWAFTIITPALAWLTIANYWHDASHFALGSDWRVNAWSLYLVPLLSSPWMWYHEHVVGHHVYTNIGHKDPDLAHAPQLMREHDSIRWRSSHANQHRILNVLFVWSIASNVGLNILNDVRATIKLSYNNVVSVVKPSKWALAKHVGGRLIYAFAVWGWPFLVFPAWKAVVWATVPNAVFSLCFMLNTQINHLAGPCPYNCDKNFYKHQVVTAQNFGNGSLFCYYFSGGLNYQIEHHLFPTINHCHLPALSAGVRKVCKKHGVPYHHAAGYREGLAQHHAHTVDMSKRPD